MDRRVSYGIILIEEEMAEVLSVAEIRRMGRKGRTDSGIVYENQYYYHFLITFFAHDGRYEKIFIVISYAPLEVFHQCSVKRLSALPPHSESH